MDRQEATARRPGKSAAAFRTISEVAQDLDVPQHVLRFWETKFTQIRPLKRGGGRRYYRPEDVALLRRIRQCLYQEGYTIKGVQRLLREGALKSGPQAAALKEVPRELPPAPPARAEREPSLPFEDPLAAKRRAVMTDVLHELKAARELLKKTLK